MCVVSFADRAASHLDTHRKYRIEFDVLIVVAAWIADDARVAEAVITAVMRVTMDPERGSAALDHAGQVRCVGGIEQVALEPRRNGPQGPHSGCVPATP